MFHYLISVSYVDHRASFSMHAHRYGTPTTEKAQTVDHNPHLARLAAHGRQPAQGKGTLERPGEGVNVVWQTRSASPTAFENALGDALEQVFEAGATTPEAVAAGLNERGFRDAGGASWTPASFEACMRELGRQASS